MLTLENRSDFYTLLDAVTLVTDGDSSRPAIIYTETGRADVVISRHQFQQAVTGFAARLQRLGIVPGDLVVIAHTQNLASIYLFWGAMLAGAIPSMFPTLTEKLDARIYMESMAELARLSEVRAVLTTDEFARQLAEQVPCPVYGSGELERRMSAADQGAGDELISSDSLDPDNIAFLQHSSGTTGLQKGVALSHRAVLNQLASYHEALNLTKEDVVVSWLPLYHDMGLIAGFLLPLIQGLPLVLMSPFDWVSHPATLFRAIDRHQASLCWLPNFAYNHCARRIRQTDLDGLTAESMRLFINCSEPVYEESHRLFLERFSDLGVRREMLAVSYAMAENTFAVSQTPWGEPAKVDIIDKVLLEESGQARLLDSKHPRAGNKVSCGPPIYGTEVRVEDDQGHPLPERFVGEVALRSDCMLSEYYRRPDLRPFQDGWYRTGDRGYLAEGEIFIVGRSKDMIINAGKNIFPQDIEAIVNGVPGIHPGRAVAFGVPDLREGTELIAVVAEVSDPAVLIDPTLRKTIEKAIRLEVVRQSLVTVSYVKLVSAQWLIKTSSGKIARGANREKWSHERG